MDTFEGTVVHGDGYARTIGFPTANLEDISGNLPEKGLYLVYTNINYFGGLCIDEKKELFLIDFNEDLYGKRLKIHILRKIKNIEEVDRENHAEDLKIARKMIKDITSLF